jgi:hypothetical protein
MLRQEKSGRPVSKANLSRLLLTNSFFSNVDPFEVNVLERLVCLLLARLAFDIISPAALHPKM